MYQTSYLDLRQIISILHSMIGFFLPDNRLSRSVILPLLAIASLALFPFLNAGIFIANFRKKISFITTFIVMNIIILNVIASRSESSLTIQKILKHLF